jgi:hypothetical protein
VNAEIAPPPPPPRIIVVEAVEQILKSKRNGWAKIIGENARNM